jgi:hypothetical protein
MARLDVDHRWGIRKSINLNVQVIAQPGAIGAGWLTDASASGAFVRTELGLRILTPVRILAIDPLQPNGRPIDLSGYVVRRDASGFGLEWWNLAPESLHRLLALAMPPAVMQTVAERAL